MAKAVISGEHELKHSDKPHDWLGGGAYFWESDHRRALEWATERKYANPAVIGAVIDLGLCLDLLNRTDLELLKSMYALFKQHTEAREQPLPVNENSTSDPNKDFLLRKLDCAVVNFTHYVNKTNGLEEYDTVRGLFLEGADLYEGSGFKDKTHIQLVVRNSKAIKGYFYPRHFDGLPPPEIIEPAN